jgi:cation transport protein ChaC
MTSSDLWVFGYGSLVWRPAFPHRARRPAWIHGYRRVFWQGSTDHRGVPGAPGRVVTLAQEPGRDARCWGMAYHVEAGDVDDVLARLDHREKGGYDRVETELYFREPSEPSEPGEPEGPRDSAAPIRVRGLMYVATPSNPNYLGPAPSEALVRQVLGATGPSGHNVEYVLKLADALREICPDLDPASEEVLALAEHVARRSASGGGS